jgi:hypothetical protein
MLGGVRGVMFSMVTFEPFAAKKKKKKRKGRDGEKQNEKEKIVSKVRVRQIVIFRKLC